MPVDTDSSGKTRVNDGGPAFPNAPETYVGAEGMTLRDYFAAKALGGMLASPPIIDRQSDKVNHAGWAENAYRFADAMLEARKK